jgi:hypothetical protein
MQPTVGRIVHYHGDGQAQPHAAIITHVWNETCVNLFVFGKQQDDEHAGVKTSVVGGGNQEPCIGEWRWPPR